MRIKFPVMKQAVFLETLRISPLLPGLASRRGLKNAKFPVFSLINRE
jgi:hypothetical protein